MIIYTHGTALIEHVETFEKFEIHANELEWESVGSEERSMGVETIYEALINHKKLGELRWTISEYPVGSEGWKETNVGKHRVIQDFDYGLENEPELDDEDIKKLPNIFKNNPKWTQALTKSTVVQYLVYWFNYFYEDPANETPYNSREGGYLYIRGGPYEAEVELRENFEGIVPEDAILEAIDEIQSDGIFYWAPSSNHPDNINYNKDAVAAQHLQKEISFEQLGKIAASGYAAGIGGEEEKAARAAILKQIAALKACLPKTVSHGGIGHNCPPEEFELHGDKLNEILESLDTIEEELASEEPSAEVIAEKASLLSRVVGWGSEKLDTTANAFAKSFGHTLGAMTALGISVEIPSHWENLVKLLESIKSWLLLILGI